MNTSGQTVTNADRAKTRRASAAWIVYPIVLAAAAGAFYLLTLRTGIGGETDTAKWQFVGKVLGVPHTTGYPLYVLISHLFSCLPLGTLAWRINFMSAVFAVCTVVTVQRILRGLLQSEILACGGAALLAVSPMFWTFAVVAGVYSLNAFLVCLVIYFLFKWADAVRERESNFRGAGRGYFYAACFVYALSFGNHVTMITLLPAFVFFALVTDRRAVLNLKTALLALLFIVITASLYSLPFISTALPSPYLENRVETLDDLWRLITASGFRQYMFAGGLRGLLGIQLPFYLTQVIAQFTVFIFLAMAAGLFLLATRHRLKLLFLLIYLLVNLFMALNYYVPHQQLRYQFIPSYAVLAVVAGFSAGLFRVITPYVRRGVLAVLSACCMLALLGIAQHTLLTNLPEFREKQKQMALNDGLANDLVGLMPEGGVILANNYSDSMLLFYKMLGEENHRRLHWRVMHDTSWKLRTPGTDVFGGAHPVSTYNVEAVAGLLRGEPVDWGPLALEDRHKGPHDVFFFHTDKALLDMAGFSSNPVDLPGDDAGKNRYGGMRLRFYRITGRPLSPGDTMRIYNEGLALFEKGLALKRRGRQADGDRALIEASNRFIKLINKNRNFAEAHFQMGKIFRNLGMKARARHEIELALDLIPGYKEARDMLGTMLEPGAQTVAERRRSAG